VIKKCLFCGKFFIPDRRVGARQKACHRVGCKKARKKEAQKNWQQKNPEYFKNHYIDYVKDWRLRKKESMAVSRSAKKEVEGKGQQMIKDKIPSSEAIQQLILLIPDGTNRMIKDEIRLRRVDSSTFAAYG